MNKFGECAAGRTPCQDCGATSAIYIDGVDLCDDCNSVRTTEARKKLAQAIEKTAESLGE